MGDTEDEAGFLERRSVKLGQTRARYNAAWDKCKGFVKKEKLRYDKPNVDASAVEYGEHLFFEGESVQELQVRLAAILWKMPDLGRDAGKPLPRLRRGMQGWRNIVPGRSRHPLPWAAAALAVSEVAKMKQQRAAVGLWLGRECYMRPGELIKVLVGDLIPPPGGPGGAGVWGVHLHPWERGLPSKTGTYDSAVMLDLARHRVLFPHLQAIYHSMPRSEPLVNIPYPQLCRIFQLAVQKAGIPALHPVLYSLRHSVASGDSADGVRDIKGVKDRGRWAAEASVRRHRKPGLVNVELNKLPAGVRRLAHLHIPLKPRLCSDQYGVCEFSGSPHRGAKPRISARNRLHDAIRRLHAEDDAMRFGRVVAHVVHT